MEYYRVVKMIEFTYVHLSTWRNLKPVFSEKKNIAKMFVGITSFVITSL